DGMGVFVHLSKRPSGLGTKAVEGQAHLQLAEAPPTDADIQVFALRMVYIPRMPFWLGNPQTNVAGSFYDAGYRNKDNTAYWLDSEDKIEVTRHFPKDPDGGKKALHYASPSYDKDRYGDQEGPIPAEFPKGYQAFYIMRSKVTQGQYADFINTLRGDERTLRFPYAMGSYRYTIRMDRNNFRIAMRPRRACNYLSWSDATAYAAWAGLRPMTELEFEKACVHVDDPVSRKYAWGTNEIYPAQVIQDRGGMQTVIGNCNTGNRFVEFDGGDGGKGPVRDDAFALPGTLEESFHGFGTLLEAESFGGTYLGALGMSGNLWELCVTVGHKAGRDFSGKHGQGYLTRGNTPQSLGWPSHGGFGFRGGTWYTESDSCRVASRMHAIGVRGDYVYRSHDVGFRAVRTAPLSEQHEVRELPDFRTLEGPLS
ncbi:MAG: SUMF1/EgtB/PvdO family nonheme iron enzyme, partial [Acidobacteriota bacterium]